MWAVDALSGDGADRGAGLTCRRTMPERSSCQQRAAPRAHSGALMDRVGFRLVPGAGSVVSLESASPTPTPNAPASRRPAPIVALVWWARRRAQGGTASPPRPPQASTGAAGVGYGPPASAGREFTPSGQSGTIALGSEAAECGAAIRKLR